MTTKSKNRTAAGLLAIFLLQALMPLVVFISIQAVKISQENYIRTNFSETSLFEKWTLTETEYQGLERRNEKEILLNHVLYDVHSVKKENGKYLLLVLSDEKEKKLEEAAESAANNQGKENTGAFSMLFAFMFYESTLLFHFSSINDIPDHMNEQKEFTSRPYLKVPTPPPDAKA